VNIEYAWCAEYLVGGRRVSDDIAKGRKSAPAREKDGAALEVA
jgi:hypothetical protein